MTSILQHKRLVLIALALAAASVAEPALAQQRWRPTEAIVVTAAPMKNWRDFLTSSHLGSAMVITASVPVSYHDLNLRNDPDVDQFNDRIDIAANLVCRELDLKYPSMIYPRLDGEDCVPAARRDGHEKADAAIANARK